jgi:hypothetical protein
MGDEGRTSANADKDVQSLVDQRVAAPFRREWQSQVRSPRWARSPQELSFSLTTEVKSRDDAFDFDIEE